MTLNTIGMSRMRTICRCSGLWVGWVGAGQSRPYLHSIQRKCHEWPVFDPHLEAAEYREGPGRTRLASACTEVRTHATPPSARPQPSGFVRMRSNLETSIE